MNKAHQQLAFFWSKAGGQISPSYAHQSKPKGGGGTTHFNATHSTTNEPVSPLPQHGRQSAAPEGDLELRLGRRQGQEASRGGAETGDRSHKTQPFHLAPFCSTCSAPKWLPQKNTTGPKLAPVQSACGHWPLVAACWWPSWRLFICWLMRRRAVSHELLPQRAPLDTLGPVVDRRARARN